MRPSMGSTVQSAAHIVSSSFSPYMFCGDWIFGKQWQLGFVALRISLLSATWAHLPKPACCKFFKQQVLTGVCITLNLRPCSKVISPGRHLRALGDESLPTSVITCSSLCVVHLVPITFHLAGLLCYHSVFITRYPLLRKRAMLGFCLHPQCIQQELNTCQAFLWTNMN